jgi:DNA polymerase III epsilon subunit-like protein
LVVLDLETSSIKTSCAEILTADFIHCDELFNIKEKKSYKIRPRIWDAHASEAVEIHGITREEAFKFPPYNEVIREMFGWLFKFKGESLVCHANRVHNVTYDNAILRFHALDLSNDAYYAFQRSFPEKQYISTHSVAKYSNAPCKLDLKSLCNHYRLGEFTHHNSAEDAMMCYKIMKNFNPDIKQFLDWEQIRKGGKNELDTIPMRKVEQTNTYGRETPSKPSFGSLL